MNDNNDKPEKQGLVLRAAAEAQLEAGQPDKKRAHALSFEEILQELRIHEVELEMQNEELRQAQLALEKSRAHYADLYNCAPVGYVTLNAEGIITEANLTSTKLLNTDRKNLLNQRFAKFMEDDYKDLWYRHFMRAKQNGGAHGCELPFRHQNNTIQYLHLDCQCSSEDEKGPLMRVTLTDISKRKNNEEALRIAAAAFDVAEGIFVTDADNIILRVNAAFTQITGYAPEEAIGHLPAFMRSDVHNNAFYEAKSVAIKQQGYWQGEVWDQRKNGEVYPMWLTKTAVKNAEGQITQYVGAFRDITEQKKAEVGLRIAAAAFEVQAGIIVTDVNKAILRVNQAFTRISGYSADYAMGKTTFFMRSGLHDNDFYESLWASVLQNGYWQGEIWNRHANGDLYPVLQTIAVVYDDQGSITHYVGSFTDISAQKQAEKILLETRDHLKYQVASTTEELEKIKAETQEVNTALSVLLKHREGDKYHAQIALSEEIEATILPFLNKLKGANKGRRQSSHLIDILEANFKQLMETYGRENNLMAAYQKLTPIETQVASMIRQGLPTKVIATTLDISPGTVSIHRKHIRKKLYLDSKAINLHSYLMSLAE